MENYMPIAAKCPSCGASLSETSVLALAPVCGHCGTVITKSGGTLGLTSAYGVNDPTITRKRVEADLEVFRDCRYKYVGMLEANKEQLNWGVERYAKLPYKPELLEVQEVPPIMQCVKTGLYNAASWGLLCCFIGWAMPLNFVIFMFWTLHDIRIEPAGLLISSVNGFGTLVWWGAFVMCAMSPYYKATAANGKRPMENARRQMIYKEAYSAALTAAEPVKAAQDHRLRCQIRELEGLITTVTGKAEDIQKILRTL